MGSRIGGDIEGLWILQGHLAGVPNDLLDSSDFLDQQVAKLADDASWSGAAADEFKAAWDRDAGAAVGIADSFNTVSTIVGTLADTLHNLDTQLSEAEATAREAGVPIPAAGGPVIGPVPMDLTEAITAYNQTFTRLRAQADQARRQALADLVIIYDQIAPPQDGSEAAQLTHGDHITLGDIVRSLWATPVAHREVAAARLNALRARRTWLDHVKSSPGLFDEVERAAARAEKRSLVGKLKDLEAKLTRIEGGAEGKWPLGRLFRYTVGDAGEDLAGVKIAARWGGAVPVLGVAAATWLTYSQAEEDHEKGWSWEHAILADGGANLASLAAGTATEAGIAAALAAAPEGVAAAGAVAAGAAVAYGVGTYGYELAHAGHWGENIHKDGVITGVGESFADAGKPGGITTSKEWAKRSATPRNMCGTRSSADMTPPEPRRNDHGGTLAALAVWAVILMVIIAVFAALHVLGANSTVSGIIGIPLCAVLIFGSGTLARHIRTRRTTALARRTTLVADHNVAEQDLWAVSGVGTTWLTRGNAYWLRRILIWLGLAAGTSLVTLMTTGIAIGATHTPVTRGVVLAVLAAVNVAVLIGVLVAGWPTTARLAGKQQPRRAPGIGATVGIGLIGAGPLATALLPVCLLGAVGGMLAVLILASLPQLPGEKAAALQRNNILAKTRRHR